MGIINNATCSICGKSYYICRSCKDKMKLNPWKLHTDTSEHYKIFQIVRGYSIGVYDAKEAKEKLGNVDLSDLEYFVPSVKNTINNILNNDKKETKENKEIIKEDEDKEDTKKDTKENAGKENESVSFDILNSFTSNKDSKTNKNKNFKKK